jgi:hypothetical protein
VVIRVGTFWMKESGNGSHDNAGQKKDGGQPHGIPLNSPEGCLSYHQDLHGPRERAAG